MRIKTVLLVTGIVSLATMVVLIAVFIVTAQEGTRGREGKYKYG